VILDEILAHKRREVAERASLRPLAELIAAAEQLSARTEARCDCNESTVERLSARTAAARQRSAAEHRPHTQSGGRFECALRQPGVSFIAEIKRKSPSGGELRPGASAADLARMYADNGAAALSVLTDTRFFGGADADLVDARAASGLAALRKDFVVSAYQLYEARAMGADAVLLIVRALSPGDLRDFVSLADGLGMAALVEAHSADEVTRALDAGARIVGVNNRDLDTLVTDVTLAPRLRPMVPPECIFVAESGISRAEHIGVLRDLGVDAVLVGESLLRSADPGQTLRTLIEAGAPMVSARSRP
jgi:indole-3-glycerol phosphate synthase